MRLSKNQIQEIKSVLKDFLDEPFKLFLFGSRTKDCSKGGDIDLLLIVEKKEIYQRVKKLKPQIINELKKSPSIDEEKIDLVVALPEDLEKDTFISTLNDKIKIVDTHIFKDLIAIF